MSGVTSAAAGLQSSGDKSNEKIIPEKFGTMYRNGDLRGDSGYAMEELLLGGRLRHRHIQGREFFQVMANVSVLALCQSRPVFAGWDTYFGRERAREKWIWDVAIWRLRGRTYWESGIRLTFGYNWIYVTIWNLDINWLIWRLLFISNISLSSFTIWIWWNVACTGSIDVHSRSATATDLFTPSRRQFSGSNTCVPMHGEVESDTGAAHKAAGSGAEVDDTESQEDGSNVINGLVLFVPGPPPPGLKSWSMIALSKRSMAHVTASTVQHRENQIRR
jgi:hypothetical protein